MSLDFTKVTYVDGETVIGADNLNDMQDAILDLDENKVEKEQGKGLSTNDYTDTDKAKVDDAYVVPEGGIPKSALASAVQTSLGKADTALQEDDLEDKASVPVTVGPTAVATFESSFADAPLKSLTVNIEPAQSGTGDPSPTNVRPISGWTGANIYVSPTTDTVDGITYPITFPTEAGTVYGGTLDVVSGELVVDKVDLHAMLSAGTWAKNGTFWQLPWDSRFPTLANLRILCDTYTNVTPSGSVTQDGLIGFIASGSTLRLRDNSLTTLADVQAKLANIQAIFQLSNPIPYQLTAQQVTTLLGTNNIWADCGDVTVTYSEYLKDIKDYVDQVDSDILSAVAPLEESYTASRNYAVGSYLFVGAKFYKATSAIQTGGTINPGTNVAQTTVAEQLMTLAMKPAILG